MPDTYRDRAGAVWLLITAGEAMFATLDPESEIRYDPEPSDIGPVSTQKGDSPGAVQRKALTQAIDAWASQHAKDVFLRVQVVKGGGGWWLLLGLALLWSGGKGRRRR